MRTLTNDYHDAHVLDLGTAGEHGPYLVTQIGVSPEDLVPKTRMFVLRPDGCWADFNAYACQGKPEAMDGIIFNSLARVLEKFACLRGRPRVVELPVDEAGLKAWVERQKGGNPMHAAQEWAINYRIRRREKTNA
jgi:hypothetical protein